MNEAAPFFRIDSMTENDAKKICEWRYPEPYDVYRWLTWDEMVRQAKEFGDPDIRSQQFRSFRSAENDLVGYAQLFPLDRAIRLGIGLRPDLCGRGYGTSLIRLAAELARSRMPPDGEVDLEVERWNVRAIRAYEKAGFRITDEYERRASHGMVSILCMVWMPGAASL
ncbi:GNAT family N-acetyltransferase [Cohnella faecalis]|uniref:GNAT family N-acetyltransferase n=2 Tax=Cohnella faecalis TaxID=2315694 RepID=A0A398CRW9_9BACL|nr:GNAT family N-acetyltransferase [Cohnella faecalis]